MIENFPDELYQLGSEHANRAKIHAYFILRLEGKNAPEFISMYWEHNMQNQTISELHTDDKETRYFSNPNDVPKSSENFYEKLYTKTQSSKLLLLDILAKLITEPKSEMNKFTFVRLIFL